MTHDAALRQIQAAEPGSSTWLSANAGSGKTRVLTDRVARLLLDGTPPQNILCLTFTRAAAGEMQNRLFARLGGWAMLDDAALRAALAAAGVPAETAAPADLARARTLFARAIETPGGLKVQTLHAFATGLLRQFPLEAGVSPGFIAIEDSARAHLLAELFDTLAETRPEATRALARLVTDGAPTKLLADIARHRAAFARPLTRQEILRGYGGHPALDAESILAALDWNPTLVGRVAAAMAAGSPTDAKHAAKLVALLRATLSARNLPELEALFLYGKDARAPFGSKAGRMPTRATRAAMDPADLAALDAFMDRVEAARAARCLLAAAERTADLHACAAAFLPAYAEAKARRGWLDFDDLIEKATALLSDGPAAEWVLWKLDGGIDHILVDESQDTSPSQWSIVAALAAEFAAGEGARAAGRTLFVVGDRKQSIYSFQGADAREFDRMRGFFADRMRGGAGLRELELEYSFRSAPAILQAVDATFAGEAGAGLGTPSSHLAFHEARPGRVDLWPILPRSDAPQEADWSDPVDLVRPDDPASRLATAIAREIARLCADPDCQIEARGPEGGSGGPVRRRVTPGDVLILVRGRSGAGEIFSLLIQACKAAGLPVAGADVIDLTEELAVRDLLALLSFLALAEDDLSLATALRSPLFGWSEAALYRLAQPRPGTLWQALRTAPGHAETAAMLRDLRDAAEFARPYELLERILTRHGGRRRLIARLGREAEDGIDELLTRAIAYEATEIPSLTGFLGWLAGEDGTVKRRLDSQGGAIRVMTVHGAKGLEAPIVILPDSLRPDRARRDFLVRDGTGAAHWRTRRDEAPGALADMLAGAQEGERLEQDRLLYVAMTRAESWLVVCGATGVDREDRRTWYGDIRQGLERLGATPLETPAGPGLRFETGDWRPRPAGPEPAAPPPPALPGWAMRPAPVPPAAARARAPSELGGAKAIGGAAGRDEAAAMRRGSQIHLLLEHLPGIPDGERARAAADLLAEGDIAATPAEAARLAAEVARLLATPALAPVFAEGALAEVDLTAHLPELGERIAGTIDRLIVEADGVLAIDYKTNAEVPATPAEVPEGILRQMGAYRAALEAIFPGRPVRTAILWTAAATLMPLPDDIVRRALAGAAKS